MMVTIEDSCRMYFAGSDTSPMEQDLVVGADSFYLNFEEHLSWGTEGQLKI